MGGDRAVEGAVTAHNFLDSGARGFFESLFEALALLVGHFSISVDCASYFDSVMVHSATLRGDGRAF